MSPMPLLSRFFILAMKALWFTGYQAELVGRAHFVLRTNLDCYAGLRDGVGDRP
jgi:hypothetical protein